MARRFQHLLDRAALDDAAGIHDGHAVGQLGDHAQVVSDPDQRGVVLTADLLHAVEDLALDGDVQRGGGLVADDQVGLVQHGDGDGHALAHAAGELVRIALQALFGRGMPTISSASRQRERARHVRVRQDGFHHLLADAQHRVQRHQRILEDHRDAVAAQLAHLFFAVLAQVLALEADLALDHFPGIDQAQQREAGHGLARAGLADQAHDFASAHGQVYAIDGRPGAGFGMECGAQSAHLQNGLAHVSHPLRKPPRRYRVSLHRGAAEPASPVRQHAHSRKRAALRGGPHLFGSRLSRRRSPTMLMDRISSSRAMPGNRLIQ